MDRSMVDAASGGALVDKTPAAARELIANITTKKALIGGGFIEEVVENRLKLMKRDDFWFYRRSFYQRHFFLTIWGGFKLPQIKETHQSHFFHILLRVSILITLPLILSHFPPLSRITLSHYCSFPTCATPPPVVIHRTLLSLLLRLTASSITGNASSLFIVNCFSFYRVFIFSFGFSYCYFLFW